MDYTSFTLMLISASALPLLAFLALILRKDILKGNTKLILLCIGAGLLGFTIIETFKEHGDELTIIDGITSVGTGFLTLFILSHFSHGHTHNKDEDGAKGIVISEAFHSLIDGAVIGATYLVTPILGYAATVGIITHELPKILGTLTLFRSLGLSIKKTILYGIAAQIGSPVAAILIYTLGKQIDHERFHVLEIASISSLGAIVLWILYLEIRYHKKHPHDHNKEHITA
ncbi:MAG: hypothetical protein RLZZ308_52 [Candidatus Parcubacteria bacterium]|jgi:zinc transporter ZupT